MSEFAKIDGDTKIRMMGPTMPLMSHKVSGKKFECEDGCPVCEAGAALKHSASQKKRVYGVLDVSDDTVKSMVLPEETSKKLDKQMKRMDRVNNIGEGLIPISLSLGFLGLLSGFMVALLHGAEGDWGYMAIYVPISSLGVFAVWKMMQTLRRAQRGEFVLEALGANLKGGKS